MKKVVGARVVDVEPGSIGEELGILPGDIILTINGHPVQDLIDYKYEITEEKLTLEVLGQDNEITVMKIEKDFDEDLGLAFADAVFDGIRRCHNRCLFCFVDQMPPGMRFGLYVKDDDYRLSFLHGNFVTLTNLREEDWQRIDRMRLSPLYVSVHATDPTVRETMLKHPRAGLIMEQLRRLAAMGIMVHTQIVLCPGINDGKVLEQTVRDLANLWPSVQSIAIVPVGLTKYRDHLYPLRSLTKDEASNLVGRVQDWQREFQQRLGTNLVYLADEIYLQTDKPIPDFASYEGFPQLENGVGLVRLFLHDFYRMEHYLPTHLPCTRKVTMVTGVSAAKLLRPMVERLNRIENLQLSLISIPNRFFGEKVTVAGLITGQDLLHGLTDQPLGDVVLLPVVMLKQGEEIFLDDMTLNELAEKLNVPVKVVSDNAADLINQILGKLYIDEKTGQR